MAEYVIVEDDSGHRYVIPFLMRPDWYAWLDLPEDDERSWDEPKYAVRIDGGDVIFEEWRIG